MQKAPFLKKQISKDKFRKQGEVIHQMFLKKEHASNSFLGFQSSPSHVLKPIPTDIWG